MNLMHKIITLFIHTAPSGVTTLPICEAGEVNSFFPCMIYCLMPQQMPTKSRQNAFVPTGLGVILYWMYEMKDKFYMVIGLMI